MAEFSAELIGEIVGGDDTLLNLKGRGGYKVLHWVADHKVVVLKGLVGNNIELLESKSDDGVSVFEVMPSHV